MKDRDHLNVLRLELELAYPIEAGAVLIYLHRYAPIWQFFHQHEFLNDELQG